MLENSQYKPTLLIDGTRKITQFANAADR
uniref:Uncharacterized protein n=1 Tax=Arundo donax TaxID=35708 RepID=A0A0A8ZPY9_ARUDO